MGAEKESEDLPIQGGIAEVMERGIAVAVCRLTRVLHSIVRCGLGPLSFVASPAPLERLADETSGRSRFGYKIVLERPGTWSFMRAIILAAGAGTRLSPLTDSCPKCLVKVGDRLLIDLQIEALRAVGVEDFVFVVGYEAEQIRSHCGATVRYIENVDYRTTNSIYSFYLARQQLDTDLFLFNCDVIFDSQVLQRMLDSGHPNVVAVDSHRSMVAGEMNVMFDQSFRVHEISKQLAPEKSSGLSIQLVKFDAAGARVVATEVEQLIADGRKEVFPTTAYSPLIAEGRLFAVEGGDLPWAEIDSIEDYEHAVGNVLPLLNAR
jgi:choline kinase